MDTSKKFHQKAAKDTNNTLKKIHRNLAAWRSKHRSGICQRGKTVSPLHRPGPTCIGFCHFLGKEASVSQGNGVSFVSRGLVEPFGICGKILWDLYQEEKHSVFMKLHGFHCGGATASPRNSPNTEQKLCIKDFRNFPGGPAVKTTGLSNAVQCCTCNAEGVSSIPGWGTKIPHAMEQLSPCTTTRESVSHSRRFHMIQ